MVQMWLLVACLAADPEPPTKLKNFPSKEGKYQVKMPAKPKSQSVETAGTTMHLATCEERDGALSVGYGDMPIPAKETAEEIETRLDGARDGAMKNSGQTLISEEKIKLAGKHPGRLLNGSLPGGKGITRSKFFIVGKRLYIVQVIGKKEFVESADAKTFLDSFKLID